jgi:hypothetical protein
MKLHRRQRIVGEIPAYQAAEKRYEEAGMQGVSEQKAEAYTEYVEVFCERQRSRPAPQ